MALCLCGCGLEATQGKFKYGHYKIYLINIPDNYCECGCGRVVKKERKFIKGHTYKSKKFSDKHRENLSKNSARKGNIPWNKGIPMSEEARKKDSESQKKRLENIQVWNKGLTGVMEAWNKGMKMSEEFCQKVSEGHKGLMVGENHPMHGKHHTEESKRKNSESHIKYFSIKENRMKVSGQRSYNWKGGISKDPYPFEWEEDLKESIRKRDNHICQICGKTQEENKKQLEVHHINYDKLDLNPNNLISLCKSCHMKTNHNRESWIKYFTQDKIKIIKM